MKIGTNTVGAALAAISLLGLAGQASAAVKYEFAAFSSFSGNLTGDFSVVLPDFVLDDGDITVDTCSASSPPCASEQRFIVDEANLNGPPDGHDIVGFVTGLGTTYYYFGNGIFQQLGVFDTVLFGSTQAGRLTISQVDDPNPVPEPGAWALMIAGFGMAGAAMRRRRAAMA